MSDTDIEIHTSLIRRIYAEARPYIDWEAVLEAGYSRFLRQGDIVADVGAHVGRHLRQMVSLIGPTGRALAFEPLPFAFAALGELALGENVVLHNRALSDFSGRSTFVHAEGTPEESGLRQRQYNRPDLAAPKEILVEVRLLDEFTADLPRLDYIKIDAEGGEIGILRGAVATIRRFRPVISAEYGGAAYMAYGHSEATLFELCRQHGYVPCDLFGAAARTSEIWMRVCNQATWDWYLVPEERLPQWQAAMLAKDCLHAAISQARAEAEAMRRSTSWRLTAPLRAVRRKLIVPR